MRYAEKDPFDARWARYSICPRAGRRRKDLGPRPLAGPPQRRFLRAAGSPGIIASTGRHLRDICPHTALDVFTSCYLVTKSPPPHPSSSESSARGWVDVSAGGLARPAARFSAASKASIAPSSNSTPCCAVAVEQLVVLVEAQLIKPRRRR